MPGFAQPARAGSRSGRNDQKSRLSAVIVFACRLLGVGTAVGMSSPVQGGPHLHPACETGNVLIGQLAVGGHPQLIVGIPNRIDQQTLIRFAWHERRAAVAAGDDSGPRREREVALGWLSAVALMAAGDQQRTNFRFETGRSADEDSAPACGGRCNQRRTQAEQQKGASNQFPAVHNWTTAWGGISSR